MLRGGGLCLAGPGDPSLNKVSPRIRALQDRLMDSLPSEGAWECLSPAQREAILSIHRSRTASTDDSSEHGEGGRHSGLRKPARLHAVPRFARSRSYDDRLESETDDSGVRGVNGTSSGANSHNSLEDDSSDTGFKRGPGRFAKVAAVDRAAKRDGKNDMHDMNNGKNIRKADIVTNGFGNVNKIISKQMNKCSGMVSGPSNITLDCRNVHGEKRRRSRIDVDDPFRECSVESSLEAIHEHEPSRRNGASDSQQTRLGLGKKNGLTENFESETKLHSLKETASSEEYDSGVNFKNDDSMDEYVRDRQNGGCEFNSNLESDRTPRSDTSTSSTTPHKRDRSLERLRSKGEDPTPRKLSGERNLPCWDRSLDKLDKSRSQEREGRSGLTHSLDKQVSPDRPKSAKSIGEPLKSNLKVGYGAKLNSSFDYRTNLNQDQLNKYSSNWNNIILSKDIPIKSSSAIAVPQAVANGRESRFAKNPSGVVASRSAGHLANKTAVAAQKKADPVNWAVVGDSRKISSSSQDRGASKKYLRSKSLDRKYLEDDSSDEDSDFETRRRTDRVRRYQRASQDWEMGRLRGGDDRGRQRGKDMTDFKPLKRNPPVSGQPIKARSVWDLSGYLKKTHDDEFDDFDDVGFRTRSDFRNRWQSEGDDVTCLRKLSDNTEFNHKQWNRRSCDFELEFQNEDSDRRSWDKADIDRKRWYRRSCDLDLDFEFHNRQRREVEFDTAWGQETLEDCDEYDPELVEAKGKRSRACVEDFMVCDSRRGQDDKGRRTRLDDVNDLRLHLEDDQERRTRLEDHYRSKTSMGSHARDKRERSRTPHLLRENGVLSFENPNYTLGGANDPRLDDALNSNNGPATHDGPLDGGLAALDSLYTELDHVCNLTRSSSIRTRRHYAHLDIGSMGVDVATGPVTNLDQADHQNNR
nr:uncharacterized protein LOC128695108 [Cherax quadricarinatus]